MANNSNYLLFISITISISTVSAIGFFYFLRSDESSLTSNTLSSNAPIIVEKSAESELSKDTYTKKATAAESNNQIDEIALENSVTTSSPSTPKVNQDEIDQWLEESMNPAFFENSSYTAYDIDTLQDMSDIGDILAMQMLAYRLSEDGQSDKAFELWKQAATYGVRDTPLHALANTAHTQYQLAQKSNKDSQTIEQALVQSLAYIKLTGLRGNRGLQSDLEQTFFQDSSALSPTVIEQANQMAQSLYDEMNQERVTMGLNPFDDAVPETIDNAFDQVDLKL